jgi:hypothetical protein
MNYLSNNTMKMKIKLPRRPRLKQSLMLILIGLSVLGCSHQSTPGNICHRKPVVLMAEDIEHLSANSIDSYYRDFMFWLKMCDPDEYDRLLRIT